MDSQSPRPKSDRAAIACRNCRQRKVRCSGGEPCNDCLRLNKECFYPPVHKRKRKARTGDLEQRSKRVGTTYKDIFSDRSDAHEPSFAEHSRAQGNINQGSETVEAGHAWLGASAEQLQDKRQNIRSSTNERSVPGGQGIGPALSPLQSIRLSRASSPDLPINVVESNLTSDIGVTSIEDSNWEYFEPWSWRAICTESGSKWMQKLTGSQNFARSVRLFKESLNPNASDDSYLSLVPNYTEIDEAHAREYVDAFYDNCWETNLGIMDRTDLEPLLRAHFENRIPRKEPAWFALRNVIFAAGYRSLLATNPNMPFAVMQAKAGYYFNNALSMFTRLILPPSSLMAIRALMLMACYVEGTGSPALKHSLCATAVHLAQCKGLYRQPDKAWGNSENETLKRNWLWWAIYAFEKHLALCSGRPSAIDDDSVSAQIPWVVPSGSNIDLQLLSLAAKHAKLQSQISRHLLSLKALSMSCQELIKSVNHYHDQLNQLLEDMPVSFRVSTLARPAYNDRHLIHLLYIHFSVHGSLMAVHAHFFYPWLISRLTTNEYDGLLEAQIAASAVAVAEAARKIILALRMVNANITTPSWLTFYYPIYAVINLFISVVNNPSLPSATSDLGLLDVCAGHFGFMEFLTSSRVSISLPRDAANVASKIVRAAKMAEAGRAQVSVEAVQDHSGSPYSLGPLDIDGTAFNSVDQSAIELTDLNSLMDLDPNAWNLFSSFDMLGSNGHHASTSI